METCLVYETGPVAGLEALWSRPGQVATLGCPIKSLLSSKERERVRVCLSHPNERPFSTPTKLARIPWPFQASFQITKQGECQNLSSKTKPSYRYFLQLPTTSPSYWGTILINEEIPCFVGFTTCIFLLQGFWLSSQFTTIYATCFVKSNKCVLSICQANSDNNVVAVRLDIYKMQVHPLVSK